MRYSPLYEAQSKSRMIESYALRLTFFLLISICSHAYSSDDSISISGAGIYMKRCALCHGNSGHGDGYIPLSIEEYPSASLFNIKYGAGLEDIINIVSDGGSKGQMSPYSPPWRDELSDQQISSVSNFVIKMRNNYDSAIEEIKSFSEKLQGNKFLGRTIYLSRCKICHGENGEGNGVLSKKVITDPPPYNLRKSTRNTSYLEKIISLGGSPLGRSKQMPAWGQELLDHEIDSLIRYIESIKQ
ncbi:c-type cytochrome [uncultured Pseudoteredinibacter sp.]|uniref:c-type cytochrome n=1 Tax=uncultured Pseudoteredinibacter sp. TaxID=1641701 RepID=UPI00261EC620|nr:c-type cytochrome [uncultured Pseudoteredinibacter sp.]